jgi:hypothetical protein
MISDDEHWLLSFYRSSEIAGALFFGRIARSLRPGPLQQDLTQHFADESSHANYWTQCLDQLRLKPLRLNYTYQERYLEAAGLPVNMMEILSITHVFEQRTIGQYARHLRAAEPGGPVAKTLERIMQDERYHLRWVQQALSQMETKYGKDVVNATRCRHRLADREVYARVMEEYGARVSFLLGNAEHAESIDSGDKT